MTKKTKRSIAPLLSAIIADCEDEINSTVEMAGGHYVLTLSKTPNSSLIIYTANA